MGLKKPEIISIYDYTNDKKCDIYTNEIEKIEEYGTVNTMSFSVPYYHYDADNVLLYQDNGKKKVNPKIAHLVNENIVKFENEVYIIKNTKKIRDSKLKLNIECMGFGVELSYKNIGFLSTKPPETNPLKITSNILYTLIARREKARGVVSSSTSNTITLDGNLSSGSNIYAGDYIAIIDGVGQGYNYEIASSSNNVITINGSLSESLLNGRTLCVIHDSKYTIGEVDSEFLVDENLDDIYRSFEFDDKKVMGCLNDISKRMEGYLTFNSYYDSFYSGFICEVGLKKTKDNYENIEFRYGKNLDVITRESDTIENIFTVIYPYGSDNLTINNIGNKTRTDSGVTYNEHTDGLGYIENYQYYLSRGYSIDYCRKHFFNDTQFKNDTYVSENDLYEDAKAELENLSLPKLTYSVAGQNLEIFEEYSYMSFNVGDKVRVFDSEIGISIQANIIRKVTNYSNLGKVDIEITNIVNRFSDYIQKNFGDLRSFTEKKNNETKEDYITSNYNRIKNGGSEVINTTSGYAEFWSVDSGTLDYTPTEVETISGGKSFSIIDSTGTKGTGSMFQVVDNIKVNRDYTASCKVTSDGSPCDLIIEERDSGNSVLTTHSKSYKQLILSEQYLEITFKTQPTTDNIVYRVRKYNSYDNSPSAVYFDNCKLELGKKSTPYIEIDSDIEFFNDFTLGDLSKLDQITTTEITDNAITTPKLAAGSVIASKISVATLSAITANLGTINAGIINSVQINGANIDIDDDISVGNSVTIGTNDNNNKLISFVEGATTYAQIYANPNLNNLIVQAVQNELNLISNGNMEIEAVGNDVNITANDVKLNGTSIVGGSGTALKLTTDSPISPAYAYVTSTEIAFYQNEDGTGFIGLCAYDAT